MRKRKNTIETLKKHAQTRGGKCLSKEYVRSTLKLQWECKEGHRWEALAGNIVNLKQWCPHCNGRGKLTIEEMQQIARSRGGECLSGEYINANTKLLWQCAEGHRWKATPTVVKHHGTWCQACGGRRKLTIEEMRQIAQSRGGKCLSKEYVRSKLKLQWECKEGHRWEALAGNIVNLKQWCPHCNGRGKLTIEEMQQIARSRGGECLSSEYINTGTKLLWQCAEGHRWNATPQSVKYIGNWCRACGGRRKLTIEEMRQIAQSRGGKCLSGKYINTDAKLLWQCAEGHQWKAEPSSVKRGHWCPECSNVKKLTIEQMQQIAESRGGKCLSGKYINTDAKLLWQCAEGHRWDSPATSVKHRGTWCPECYRIKRQKE